MNSTNHTTSDTTEGVRASDTSSDEHVARSLWAAETMQLLNVLRDHLYARSLDGRNPSAQTPVHIMEILETAKVQMLAVYTASGSRGTVMPAEVDAAWTVLTEHLLGMIRSSESRSTTTPDEAINRLAVAIEAEAGPVSAHEVPHVDVLYAVESDDEDEPAEINPQDFTSVDTDSSNGDDESEQYRAVATRLEATLRLMGIAPQVVNASSGEIQASERNDVGASIRQADDYNPEGYSDRRWAEDILDSPSPAIIPYIPHDEGSNLEEDGSYEASPDDDVSALLVAPRLHRRPFTSTISNDPTCVICLEGIGESSEMSRMLVPLTSCGHVFHASCAIEFVRNAMKNESLFPPRCCAKAIPYDVFGAFLTRQEADTYDLKLREYMTPDRLYCSSRTCSTFLGAKGTAKQPNAVACPRCATLTCDLCGGAPHSWHIACSSRYDADERALLEMGKRAEWQRCPRCKRIVEKNGGCVHMVCLCSQEFCYRCGQEYHDGPCVSPVAPSATMEAIAA